MSRSGFPRSVKSSTRPEGIYVSTIDQLSVEDRPVSKYGQLQVFIPLKVKYSDESHGFSRYLWSSKLETTRYWKKLFELGPSALAFSSLCSSSSWLPLTVSLPRYLSKRLLLLKTLKGGCVKWRRTKSKISLGRESMKLSKNFSPFETFRRNWKSKKIQYLRLRSIFVRIAPLWSEPQNSK